MDPQRLPRIDRPELPHGAADAVRFEASDSLALVESRTGTSPFMKMIPRHSSASWMAGSVAGRSDRRPSLERLRRGCVFSANTPGQSYGLAWAAIQLSIRDSSRLQPCKRRATSSFTLVIAA